MKIVYILILNTTSQSKEVVKIVDLKLKYKIEPLFFFFFRYHLKDVIVGKIYFLLVRIKIKTMELSIIRRETTGSRKIENIDIRITCTYTFILSK